MDPQTDRGETTRALLDAPEPARVTPPEAASAPAYPPAQIYPAPPAGAPPASPARGGNPVVPILVGLVLLVVALVVIAVVVVLVALGAFVSRVQTGPASTVVRETDTVPLGSAHTVDVTLNIGAGTLIVQGGATGLVDATYTYDMPQWRPEVSSDVNRADARVSIRQPSTSGGRAGSIQYDWDVRLNNGLPVSLHVNEGAGTSTLTLGGVNLTQLEFTSGAGSTTIDLSGKWAHDVSATVHGGAGQTTLVLPRDTAVRVIANGGLGNVSAPGFRRAGDTYTNAAFGKPGPTIQVTVDLGVGQVRLSEAP